MIARMHKASTMVLVALLGVLLQFNLGTADDSGQQLFMKAMTMDKSGHLKQAVELFKQVQAIEQDNPAVYNNRGVVYLKLKKYKEAIEDFSKCIKLYLENKPAVTAAYFHLARAQAKTDRAAAIENLKKTLRLNEQIGGLSPDDLMEVNSLLDELSNKGG